MRTRARRTRRSFARSKRPRRSYLPSRRRSGGKKRTYRKKGSRKMILNMTSTKKRDTMINYTNVTGTSQIGGTAYSTSPAIITGGYTTFNPFVWVATARDNTTANSGGAGLKFFQSTRTATTCFMRGLAESIEIQVSDGLPWQWRRICFTYKGIADLIPSVTTAPAFSLSQETSSGWVRTVNALPNNTYRDNFEAVIFRGSKGVDFSEPLTAPLDPTRITVKYDKTRTIASGNEDGCIRKYKFWHGMNKNLVYADDESGGVENVGYFSTQSKAGMGDYVVVDYFLPRTGSTSANKLSFNATASLYWHEK
ncbi:putative capsid protein [Sierra dome spider associated circular virus 1]|uniref:Putative capsid protein n=1 Tax=Sierra dome spider associated circular virus 1 TaxID=2293299 RepID=A0A346BP85_9VIRU|nr:putative capsid protein [Sierra dome spider associated circular virus 1]AXL65882.1 putative capsid protein [Sierra dome spider associated circular virus 1]